jgi:DNA-binding NarL/FixJ family response regulator
MKVLYVTSSKVPKAATVLHDLLELEPRLDIQTVIGAGRALVEVRTGEDYRAIFVAASVPHNEALPLIASLRRDRLPIAIVVIITAADRGFFAQALTAGADDVLVLQGARLIAAEDTLRRIRQNRHVLPEPGTPLLRVLYAGRDDAAWRLLGEIPFVQPGRTKAGDDGSVATTMSEPGVEGEAAEVLVIDEEPGAAHALQVVKWVKQHVPALPVVILAAPSAADLDATALELGADEVLSKAGTYRRRLIGSLHRLFLRRATAETTREQLLETQAFERALRERDREELASLRRALREEQERVVVLEGTLRHTEDRAKSELSALEEAHRLERRRLEESVAQAAERLHRVASKTQVFQSRLDAQLGERMADRDRLLNNSLVGYAVLTRQGHLVRCSEAFATMLGHASSDDAIQVSSGEVFAGTPDHARLVEMLEQGATVDRVESTGRRADGRPVRVLTSASLLAPADADPEDEYLERLLVDLSERTKVEVELRLSRRLEAAGRLAAEMGPEIESTLGVDAERTSLLVRQLLAFCRHQAKPAGFLSLNDAIRRHDGLIRQLAGGAVDLKIALGDIEPVTAGEEDIEQLILEFVTSAAGSLPYGGRLTISTASETDQTFVLRTTLTAVSAGYGVLSPNPSSSLARLVARCGGVLRTSGDAGRTSTLHVYLPC